MKSAGAKLLAAARRGPVMMAGVYDALSALLVEKGGFEAAYLSGGALSVGLLGKPDIGLLTLDDVAGAARRIVSAVATPLLVDIDTGFGGVWNVTRAIRELEAAGAAGVQIEDQAFPKRCGHLAGKTLIPAPEMAAKIRAARAAKRDRNFLIVARTDARGVSGMADALRRAALYRRAGADVIFPEALESVAEFRAFGRQKSLGLLLANMTEFGRSPVLSVDEVARLGFRLILYPMTAFRVAARAMESALRDLKIARHNRSLIGRMQTRAELYELNRYSQFTEQEARFLPKAKRHRRNRTSRSGKGPLT